MIVGSVGIIHSVVRACMMAVWWLRATIVDFVVNWSWIGQIFPNCSSLGKFARKYSSTRVHWLQWGNLQALGLVGFG